MNWDKLLQSLLDVFKDDPTMVLVITIALSIAFPMGVA
jgi:hypothetical protein